MRISVIGAGRVGTVHAATLASLGHHVVAVDRDEEQVARLGAGESPYTEPHLAHLLREAVSTGRLEVTTSLAEAARTASVHFLCLATPSGDDGSSHDTSTLEQVVSELVPQLTTPSLVVGRSTVPVGTASRLAELAADKAPEPDLVEVAWNPEFLREGHAVDDSLEPDRIVVGVDGERGSRVLHEVYAPLLRAGTPLFEADLATAELAKSAANVMLAARLSLVNALAELCERTGADVELLSRIVGSDPRIGDGFLRPGLGFGGSCLPKDLRGLAARGRELGAGDAMAMLEEVDRINLRQRDRTVALAAELVGGQLDGARVAVLGAAFKAGVDDVRESPAMAVIERLHDAGALVRVHDPQALDAARRELTGPEYVDSPEAACREADVVVLLTDWPEYAELAPEQLRRVVRSARLLDTRLVVRPSRWRRAGWELRQLGRAGMAVPE